MTKAYDAAASLIDDLDQDELFTLVDLISGLNRLEMIGDAPKYSTEEIDLIGRFANLPDEDDEVKSPANEAEEIGSIEG